MAGGRAGRIGDDVCRHRCGAGSWRASRTVVFGIVVYVSPGGVVKHNCSCEWDVSRGSRFNVWSGFGWNIVNARRVRGTRIFLLPTKNVRETKLMGCIALIDEHMPSSIFFSFPTDIRAIIMATDRLCIHTDTLAQSSPPLRWWERWET